MREMTASKTTKGVLDAMAGACAISLDAVLGDSKEMR